MSSARFVLVCAVLVLNSWTESGKPPDENARSRRQANCDEQTTTLGEILQEQNFQLEQSAKKVAALNKQVTELTSTIRERDNRIAELSSSFGNLVTLGSNCTRDLMGLQLQATAMRRIAQAVNSKCRNAGKSLNLVKLDTGRYYFSDKMKANWFEALKFCNFHGLQLASIESEFENTALTEKMNELGMKDTSFHYYFWISGADLGQEGRWYWTSTGQDMVFSSWHEGQPDGYDEGQNCAALWRKDGIIKWDDVGCGAPQYFICEMPRICEDVEALYK